MEEETKEAYNHLIKLLCKRDYSRYKLEKKLREKSFSATAIDQSISKVIEQNYLREDYYIEARIKGFMNKNCSISYIKYKLAEEFLDVASSTIQEIFDEYKITEKDQIETIIQKKLPKEPFSEMSYDDKIKAENKIFRYLHGKGHQISLAKSILHSII